MRLYPSILPRGTFESFAKVETKTGIDFSNEIIDQTAVTVGETRGEQKKGWRWLVTIFYLLTM